MLIKYSQFELRPVEPDTVEYRELEQSILTHGQLVPIIIRPLDEGYEIVDGAHRFHICQKHGIQPKTDIQYLTDEQVLVMQVTINDTRVPSDRLANAKRILLLTERFEEIKLPHISNMLGKSPTWVKQQLNLLNLTTTLQRRVLCGEIPLKNAYLLSKVPQEYQIRLAPEAILLETVEFADYVSRCEFGREKTEEWTPSILARPVTEFRKELLSNSEGNRLYPDDANCAKAFRAGVLWAARMDSNSIEARTKLYNARRKNE